MKKIIVHAGFRPGRTAEYRGEHIFRVINTREAIVTRDFLSKNLLDANCGFYGLDNGAWIKDLGDEKYVSDWTAEERWGRVEELETDDAGSTVSSETLGFIILRVDRSRGLL